MKVHLSSCVTNQSQEIEIEFRPVPALPTGTVTCRQLSFGGTMYEIEWIPNQAVVAVLSNGKRKAPAKLTKGSACRDEKLGEYVQFSDAKIRVRIADKPDLAELWHWVWELQKAEGSARTAYWDAERAAQRESLMNAVPPGSVKVVRIGSAPDPWEAGMSVGVWQSEDGRTFAGSPDKQANDVGHITEDRLTKASTGYAERQKADAERKQQRAAETAQYQAELKATVVPGSVLATYRKYRGDDEKAWEQGDEGAWAEIRKYRDAIEAQNLA